MRGGKLLGAPVGDVCDSESCTSGHLLLVCGERAGVERQPSQSRSRILRPTCPPSTLDPREDDFPTAKDVYEPVSQILSVSRYLIC